MRPAILMVETDADRRRAISRGLARFAYEVVPVPSAEEGLRFAQGLGPSVIVAPADMLGFGDGAILERFTVRDRAMKRTLLLLGNRDEQAGDLPEDVLFLNVADLSVDEVIRRLRLLLVGREVGIDPDLELRSLVGDLALVSVLELLRSLNRVLVSGVLHLPDGFLMLDDGQVVAARTGMATGIKAVYRLSRASDGPFRLTLGHTAAEREIDIDFFDLVIRSIEEAQVKLPNLRSRPRLAPGAVADDDLDTRELQLLHAVDRCGTVQELLDALPASDGRIVEALDRLVDRGLLRLDKPLAPVAIVTDSTADLPPTLARQHDILVAPLGVLFGKHEFRDGVDITPRDFYRLLEEEAAHPQTRPPSVAEFLEHYTLLLRQQDVVSVHISEKLSDTVVHARKAVANGEESVFGEVRDHGRPRIGVVDTKSVSMGVGMMALFAARMALRGRPAAVIEQRLQAMAPRLEILFAVDSLDALVRGGRLSKARAAVGKLLGIKPILGVVGGEVVPLDRVRGGRRAHPRIIELLSEKLDPEQPIVVAVAHAKAPVWADRLAKLLAERFTLAERIETDIGPVVGTHTGAGCVGCVAFQPTTEEWADIAPLDVENDATVVMRKPRSS